MTASLYFDVNVDGRVARALLDRGFDVLRAQDDNADELDDPDLFERATELGRVVVTYDHDFLSIATSLQRAETPCAGLVFVHVNRVSIGELVDQLQTIAECMEPDELQNRVVFVPL